MILLDMPLMRVISVSVVVFTTACSHTDGAEDDTPSDDQKQYVINSDNYVALIAEALDVYVGDTYNKPLLHAYDLLAETAPATSSFDEDTLLRRQTYDCVNGGTASSVQTEYFQQGLTPYPNPQVRLLDFLDCQHDTQIYSGDVEFTESGGIHIKSEGFAISALDLGSELTFSGDATRQYPYHAYDNLEHEVWSTENANIQLTTDGVTTRISDMSSNYERGYYLLKGGLAYNITFSGNFTLRSQLTEGRAINVRTADGFVTQSDVSGYPVAPVDWWFSGGQLWLMADDSSLLSLQPDVVEEGGTRPAVQEFLVTLMNPDETRTFKVPWTQWLSNFQFEAMIADPSEPAEVSPPEPDTILLADDDTLTPSAINRDNYSALLDKVFGLYTGTLYKDSLIFETGEPIMVNILNDTYLGRNMIFQSYPCDDNTGAEHNFYPTLYYGDQSFGEWDFNQYNCDPSGFSFDGYLQNRNWNGAGFTLASNSLKITDPQGATFQFAGWVQDRSFGKGAYYGIWRTQDSEIKVSSVAQTGPVEDYSVTGMSTYFGRGYYTYAPVPPEAYVDGKFTVQASWTGQQTVQVQTLDAIRLAKTIYHDESGEPYFADYFHPVAGRLSLVAGDGSSLTLAVDTGDDATVTIAITDHMGNTEFTDEWSQWSEGFE